VRKKYACKACEEGIQLAPLPPQPIPKSMWPCPGLLAYIATAKYQYGLPLYRLDTQTKAEKPVCYPTGNLFIP